MTKKIYIVEGSASYHQLFRSLDFTLVNSVAEADLVCFTGGADVSPWMYKHQQHRTTYNDERRDVEESVFFHESQELGKPMVGICRGGQFLNVMSGGEMYQDVDKHGRSHSITDVLTGEVVYVSSTHHQMMKPSPEAVLVAYSTLGGDREWWDGQVFAREKSEQDVEVVFYPGTKCLCFQPHPEFSSAEFEGMRAYFATLLTRYLI